MIVYVYSISGVEYYKKKSLKFINKSLYAATKSLDLINWPLDPLTLPLSQKGGP